MDPLYIQSLQMCVNVCVGCIYIEKKKMNMLGVIFDSKLNWNAHVANAICKAKKSLYALCLLRKFFNDQEMRILLDSKFYSVLLF